MKKIFIGSSSSPSSVEKAKNLKELLEGLNVAVTYWEDVNVYPVGGMINGDLFTQPLLHHAAIFVFGQDDKTEKGTFVPRDNVIYEAGLFSGALGREKVAICHVEGTHYPSDLQGVTYLEYTSNNIKIMKDRLSEWLNRYVRDDRLPQSYNNIIMKPREAIHQQCPIENRMHMNDGAYKFIRRIRLMNLTSNLVLNPQVADAEHRQQSKTSIPNLIQKILKETNAPFELILVEPHQANLYDCSKKITNRNLETIDDLVYNSWETIKKMICTDSIYEKAYKENRFRCFSVNISIPYAIFNVEFQGKYKQYDHVKIDLYSSKITSENQRRSFIVWREDDPDNYDFFVQNFDSIRADNQICQLATPERIQSWLDLRHK